MNSSQDNGKTLRDDKIMQLYNTGDWTDCIFIFQDEKIPAHKLILTCSSPVFESMFYGPMASSEIDIRDIEASDFRQMLEFIYTNNVTIHTVINAWSLLYISQKYFLHDLKKICIEFINLNPTISTLLLSFEYSELYNLRLIRDNCWKDILLSAKEVLESEYHMQASTFCLLLSQNSINANEIDLIEAALKWSDEECVFQSLETTTENKFNVLIRAGIFSKLRFSNLGKSSFFYFSHLFIGTDPRNVTDFMSLVNSSTELRKRVSHHVKYKFRETYKIEQNLMLFERNEFNCNFSVTRKIVTYGVAVTPPHQGGLHVAYSTVFVSIFDPTGTLVYEIKDAVKITSDYEHPHLVNFLRGITFEALIPYRISVKYSSPSDNSYKPNELLCFYVSSDIKTHANSMTLYFNDEVCGGVVRGVSFYVL